MLTMLLMWIILALVLLYIVSLLHKRTKAKITSYEKR